MSPQYSTHDSTSRSPSPAPCARFHRTKRPALRSIGAGALCAIVGLASSLLAAPNEASAATFGLAPFMPGSVVVSQGGTIFGGTNAGTGVELNGEVDVYPPNANGDMRPEARFTNGSYGPTTMVFDSSGDLWVGNENTSNLFELARAQLGTRDPVPRRHHLRGGRGIGQPVRYGLRQCGRPLGGKQRVGQGLRVLSDRTGCVGRPDARHDYFELLEHSHFRRCLRRRRRPMGVDSQ